MSTSYRAIVAGLGGLGSAALAAPVRPLRCRLRVVRRRRAHRPVAAVPARRRGAGALPGGAGQRRHNFYGFPVYGEVATQLGQHMGGDETTTDTRSFDPDPVRRQRYAEFVDRHLPRFGGPELYSKTCLYTVPPDQDFVLDTLPGSPQIVVAIGAGHAFKFAALIGGLPADLAQDRAPSHPIDAFSITRPALTDPGFPSSFHV